MKATIQAVENKFELVFTDECGMNFVWVFMNSIEKSSRLLFQDVYQAQKFLDLVDIEGDETKILNYLGFDETDVIFEEYDIANARYVDSVVFKPKEYYTSKTEELFMKTWHLIEHVVEFDPTWHNGTGYMNGAVHFELPIGGMSKSVDEIGRKVILIGTRFGTVVVFQRAKRDYDTYVYNAPREFERLELLSERALRPNDLVKLFGSWYNLEENVGNHVEHLAKVFKEWEEEHV